MVVGAIHSDIVNPSEDTLKVSSPGRDTDRRGEVGLVHFERNR